MKLILSKQIRRRLELHILRRMTKGLKTNLVQTPNTIEISAEVLDKLFSGRFYNCNAVTYLVSRLTHQSMKSTFHLQNTESPEYQK